MPTPLVVVHRGTAAPTHGPAGGRPVALQCATGGSIGTVITSGHAHAELQRHAQQVRTWLAAQHPHLHPVLVVVALGDVTARCARTDCTWSTTVQARRATDPAQPRRKVLDTRAAEGEVVAAARSHATS